LEKGRFLVLFGIILIFYNKPELGAGIDPGMALTPLSSSIGQGSNPQPSDCEPSALPLDHSFRRFLVPNLLYAWQEIIQYREAL